MPAKPVTHPSAELLQSLNLGKLDNATAENVVRHLEACPACRQQMAALSGDDFLVRARQAHGRNSSLPPDQPLADAARSLKSVLTTPASAAPTPQVPPELAGNPQYDILRELGRGGMGVVYLARNKLMDRLEVLKVVNRALLDRPGAVERFLREIRSAARLEPHPNVVMAYSAFQVGELLVFAMQYVEGEDLAKFVKARATPLPVPLACYCIHQVAVGLQYAFEKGLVHRDIKPQNLMLSREGKKYVVKVLDFGLAKAKREEGEGLDLTGEGRMLGTPDYMAPEQACDAAHADVRADIYSLGCTLYYLLTGAPPFEGNSLYQVMHAHQSMQARPLNQVRPDVPEELAAVVAKMLAKDPAQRFPTPIEVARALAPFAREGVKRQPTSPRDSSASEQPAAFAWDTLEERHTSSTESRTSVVPRKLELPGGKPAARNKWLIGAGVGACGLLLVLVGLWAGGVFKVKTPDGTIVLEDLPKDLPPGERPRPQRIPAVAHWGKDWRLEGDELIQGSTDENRPTSLIFGDTSWTDYDVSVEARRIKGPGLYILFFRMEKGGNQWEFRLLGLDKVRDYKTVNDGVGTVIEKKGWICDDNWHKIAVKVRGDHLEWYLDGQLDFTLDDSRHPRGAVGLWTWKTSVRFRNLRVTDARGGVLVDGVGSLDLTGGRGLAPGTEKFIAGTIWKGKVKSTEQGKAELVRDAILKVVKREGATFEGQYWIDKERLGLKIEGNVDQLGTISWRPTAILAGDLPPRNLEVRGGGFIDNGKRIRAGTLLHLPHRALPVEMTLALEQ